jgi:UDP-N-acetylglucosamine--N-acetylmuramyl-(pentapeptide) pyrophosphoryl-undecaprenol N-acetylglucosamine transferase
MLPTLAPTDVLWIGSRGGVEEQLAKRAGLEFVGLRAGGLRGKQLWTMISNATRIFGSVEPARAVLARFRPDVVFATGGYACVSVTLAARFRRVPVVIYLPDIVPGLAIRFLSRFATRISVTSEESYHYFRRDKVTVTGYPVRPETFTTDRNQARQALGLAAGEPTVLVFGGSRGARSINRAVVAGLGRLLPVCQLVHVSGRLDADWVAGVAKGLPEAMRARYRHFAFLHEMPLALVAADLAVSRAGAATLGEFPAAGLPAVLVPYPYSGQHQLPNAEYMERNGAAVIVRDGELEGRLVPTILGLLENKEAMASMRESAKAMARDDAAEAIAEQLWQAARHDVQREAGV